jgi:hypothetical protein
LDFMQNVHKISGSFTLGNVNADLGGFVGLAHSQSTSVSQ